MRNRQRDKVMRDVLQTALGSGAGISRIMFSACLSYSQATGYLSHMMEYGLAINDVEQEEVLLHDPKGSGIPCRAEQHVQAAADGNQGTINVVRCMDFGRHSACAVSSPVEAPCTE